MLEVGLEPIMQLTARDRNLMGLQSDLLAAWALGVRTVLGLTGDPLKVGKYEELATAVGDVDSTGLAKLLVGLNEGRLAAGEMLSKPTAFLVAGAANPLVDQLAKLEQKLDAGVGLFQTNIVYDVERFAEWWAPMVEAGIPERAKLLVDVTPPRSKRMLQFMHDKIPGVEVDDATFARIDGLEGDEAKAAGVEIAVDVIRGVHDSPVSPACTSWRRAGRPRRCRESWRARGSPASLIYRLFFRLVLERIDPERAHGLAAALLGRVPTGALRRVLGPRDPRLRVQALGRTFPSPLGVAAGVDKDAVLFEALGAIGFGFVEWNGDRRRAAGQRAPPHRALPRASARS